MKTDSRTAKSLKNSRVAFFFFILTTILNFISRKVFLDYLGVDVLGLNTTASNLLSFLNLAELGIGTAVASTLYRPLTDNNRKQVCEIISLQGWLYRRIAVGVGVGGFFLLCFFQLIFAKMSLPMWYAYGSFGVLLFGALFGYFVNYRQILLSADQKEYKVSYCYRPLLMLKILCQIVAVKFLSCGYIGWLAFEFFFVIIISCVLNRTIDKEYPYLKISISEGKRIRYKYPEVITKIKQLFFHKVSSFALGQTSLLILYGYTSLSMVAVYGNYMLIVSGITGLLWALFNMDASIGNLIAEGNKIQILRVFNELFSLRFFIVFTVCFCVYILSPMLISLWVGREYLLDDTSLILIVAIMYIGLNRPLMDSYLAAYGLFRDVWAPITEAVINITLSVFLGYFYGLQGILLGALISQIVIVFCWKPYFLFKYGLHERFCGYVRLYGVHVLVSIPVFLIAKYVIYYAMTSISNSPLGFLLISLITITTFALLLSGALYITTSGFRDFIQRLKLLINQYLRNA